MIKNLWFILFSLVSFVSCKEKDYLVTLHTEHGDIQLILYDQTPAHKENFLRLAKEGKYDSTTFHRIIQNFMIQGGDVNARERNENEIDYTLPAEFIDSLIHHRGAIGAARMGDRENPQKRSNGSQFYIVQGEVFEDWQLTTDFQKATEYLPNLAEVSGYDTVVQHLQKLYEMNNFVAYQREIRELIPIMETRFDINLRLPISKERLSVYTSVGGAPHLDDGYTVFGRVVGGLEVVDKIASVQTGHSNKPLTPVYVTISLEEMPKEEWEKKYGGRGY